MFLTLKRLVRFAVGCTLAAALVPAHAAPWTLTGAIGTHDPNIYKTSSTWWIFETTDNGGIGVKYSADGLAWTQGTAIFGSGLSWWSTYLPSTKTAMVWAPGCGEYAGNGYCYYAISSFGSQKSAIGLTTSAGGIAAGAWVDQGAILTSKSGDTYNAIDPSFVVANNGDTYLVFGSFWNGIHITRVSKVNLKPPTGGIVNIAKDSTNGIENGFVVKKTISGTVYYYLFASKGACCQGSSSTYYIVVGRSTSITGPYVDKAGVAMLSGGGTVLASSGSRYKGPGGQSLLADGSTIAWHAYDSSNSGAPVLFINSVTWGSDGWPAAVW